MEWDIKSLLESQDISYTCAGTDRKVKGAAAISVAQDTDLSFCYHVGEKGFSLISQSNAGIILCNSSMEGLISPKVNSEGTKPTAKIGRNCYIGDFTVIGDNCEIGDDSIVYDRVSLVQNCTLGDACVIQQGVTLGADGFAFERDTSGNLERFPHIMGVKIGKNVEISANSSVARGSLSDTVIGDGSKLDALVHVAHNVKIGKYCELTAGTIIGGSTTLGDMVWTGLNSMIKDNIKIGNNVIVAASAGVIHDVVDGDIVAGVPAKSIRDKVTTNMRFLMAGQKQE